MADVPTIPKRGCFPSEKTKIRESVEIGSVFLALGGGFFTPEALLQWLTTVGMTERTQVAYKAVCVLISPDKQYMDDTYHFLTKKPEYASIAIGYALSDSTFDQNVEGCNNPIIAHICDEITKINTNQNVRNLSGLILAGKGSEAYIRSKLVTCYRARCFPHLRTVTDHEYNTALICADWTCKFRYNETLVPLMIERVAKLQQIAPMYYAGVAYKTYHNVAVKLNKEKLLSRLSRDDMAVFNIFFPGVIDPKILDYNDLAYKISLLDNDISGYVLGFPIQTAIPTDEQIHQAIQILTDQGVEKYAETIKSYVATTYTSLPPFMGSDKISYSNETDVIMENIDNYSPFDIVSFQTGIHMYRFTRPEFAQLLKSKKNPWTNEWLPVTVLSSIKARMSAVKELGFPPSRPLKEILERVENETLFEEDEPPQQPSIQQHRVSQPVTESTLYQREQFFDVIRQLNNIRSFSDGSDDGTDDSTDDSTDDASEVNNLDEIFAVGIVPEIIQTLGAIYTDNRRDDTAQLSDYNSTLDGNIRVNEDTIQVNGDTIQVNENTIQVNNDTSNISNYDDID